MAQKITLSVNNVPLMNVFDQISRQSGYDFLVSTENLKTAKPVSLTVKNEEIEKVLEKLFSNQPLKFQIQEKILVVSKKETTTTEKIKAVFKTANPITGKVTDTTGTPLPGAIIKIKGHVNVVTTNNDGTFLISAQPGNKIAPGVLIL